MGRKEQPSEDSEYGEWWVEPAASLVTELFTVSSSIRFK